MYHRQGHASASPKMLIQFRNGLVACLILLGLTLLGLSVSAVPLHAQLNESGTITGAVTDKTGAVVPAASVVITNVGTGLSRTLKTNDAGQFTQVGLNVGNYSVTVSMDGFETYKKTDFYLGATAVYTVNAVLQPGSTTQVVEVTANAVVPELTSNELSSEIPGEEANMLALNGRNYQDIGTLLPGVVNLSAGTPIATGGYIASNSLSVNGMGRSSVFYTLDGVWNEETGNLLTNTVTPPPEAIDQMKVLQNNYSVQYNMMGGAMFMIHTKSGTDQVHGQAWYFIRNRAFNALNYFFTAKNAQAASAGTILTSENLNPPFRWNIGGLGLGGPLFIPHFHSNSGQHKTFYYINGQYVKQISYSVNQASFPTQDELNGIFPGEIHDPDTLADYPTSQGPGYVQYTIPQSKIVPQAQAMIKAFVPAGIPSVSCTPPNCTIIGRSTNDYQVSNPQLFKQLDWMAKLDHDINSRFRLTGEYFQEGVRQQLPSASRMGSYSPYNYDIFFNNDSVGQIHLSEVIGPSMLNQISVAMDRYVVTHTYGGIHLATDIPGYVSQLPYSSTVIGLPGVWLPQFTFSAGWGQFGTNSTDTQWRTAYLAETLTDNWSWSKGKHNLSAGGTFFLGRSRINSQSANITGTFNYDGHATGTPIADFLVGAANTFVQGSQMVRKKLTYPIYSPYFEDVWKATSRLTLTAGVRYSFMPFANAAQGYATAFDPEKFDPNAVPGIDQTHGYALIKGPNYNPVNGLIYNGFGGIPLNLSSAHQNFISPSIGFAWDVYGEGKTSLRGGYSINYLKSGSSSDCQANCIGLPTVTQVNLVYPNLNFPDPMNGQTAIATAPSLYGEDIHHITAAQIHSFSLSLQQQEGPNWLFEIAGAGVAGRHLPIQLNINQPKPFNGYNYDPWLNVSGSSSVADAPYQGYNNLNYATSTGIANWTALETSLRHPVGKGVILRAQFTWSHGLSDVPSVQGYADENSGVQDAYNPMHDYGNTQLNQHLSFSSSVIYKLPRIAKTGWVDSAFGGWQFSVVGGVGSGRSFTAGLSTNLNGLTTRPNMNPNVPMQRYHGSHPQGYASINGGLPANGTFFNTCAFMVPGDPTGCGTVTGKNWGSSTKDANGNGIGNGMFGNAPVGNILGPGMITNNVTMFKIFQATERYKLRLRAEAFNVLNHPNFSGQQLNYGDANFGTYTSTSDPREAEFSAEIMF